MRLKWGIFWRMRGLVVKTNEMVEKYGAMTEAQGEKIDEIHETLTNHVMHKLDNHEAHLQKQDKKIGRIEQALQIKPEEE